MQSTFSIFRFDSRKDREPHFQEYRVEVDRTDRILDCLNRIRWEQDPSLTVRMSCAHGVCGSDAMRINGVCALACQRLVKDYGDGPIRIEPLPHFPVLKDLVVDLSSFFEKYRVLRPYLLPAGGEADRETEYLQSPAERKVFDEAIRCILCACCTAACPVSGVNNRFLGPAALLRAFRYLFDSRDGERQQRMQMLDTEDAIWGCKTLGKCTEVCPKEIKVTESLGKVKKAIYDSKQE